MNNYNFINTLIFHEENVIGKIFGSIDFKMWRDSKYVEEIFTTISFSDAYILEEYREIYDIDYFDCDKSKVDIMIIYRGYDSSSVVPIKKVEKKFKNLYLSHPNELYFYDETIIIKNGKFEGNEYKSYKH